ncbi:MAG: c(7)-type cytochrome triheme domain-containing protein [Porticoccus sp.]
MGDRGEANPGSMAYVLCLVLILIIGSLVIPQVSLAGERPPPTWKKLAEDGLHDPDNLGLEELQEPGDALSTLPVDKNRAGNQVDWVMALQQEYIQPRTNIFPETKVQLLDLDIIMGNTGEMHMVRFPHLAHTEWLDCVNCHDEFFKPEVDANPVNMFAILVGEFCGRCHGAVSFPLTECGRCHSVQRATYKGTLGAQYLDTTKEEILKMLEKSREQSALEPIGAVDY